ncbi:MAG TPA: hypothetical protein VJH96_01440 [Patescibacteria group bacterium]|nr:hypothetical protein [Patescibacteria group bacterium]
MIWYNARMKHVLILLFFFFLGVKGAHAYIDPGTGSYLIQIAIGSLLGGLYVVKKFWKSISAFITSFLRKLRHKQ